MSGQSRSRPTASARSERADAEREGGGSSSAAAPVDPYTYDGFRDAARDDSRSVYGKIGFPDSYRADKEEVILADIRRKVTNLERGAVQVIDIGSGCSPLTSALIDHACAHGQRLVLIDSPEMLGQLKPALCATMLAGRFPFDHRDFVIDNAGKFDVVIVYSVLQYVLAEASLDDFLDSAVALLADGGQLLAGDLPNESMRSRYADSPAGASYRQAIGASHTAAHGGVAAKVDKFDDGDVLAVLARYRAMGFHAYVVPQSAELPMANRREDVLIVRP
jgi:hypothetical protein